MKLTAQYRLEGGQQGRGFCAVAAAHILTGRLEQATEMLEAVIAETPDHSLAQPWPNMSGSLINARQFPGDDETLARMEKLAHQPSLEGQVYHRYSAAHAPRWHCMACCQ